MFYKNKDDLLKDFLWLSEKCNIELFTKHGLNDFDKNQFVTNISINDVEPEDLFDNFFQKIQLQDIKWDKNLTEIDFPQIVLIPEKGIRIIIEQQSDKSYKTIGKKGIEYFVKFPSSSLFKTLRFKKLKTKTLTSKDMFKTIALDQKRYLFYAIIATISINLLALGSSFFTMQVYDRVVPTNGISTLISLSIGVFIAIFLEMLLKFSRSIIVDQASKNMDVQFSHNVFERFLNIRMDNMPKSIGSFSGQLQSYTTIRQFITTAAIFLLVDFPFSFMFLLVILMLGGVKIGMVLLVFLTISITIGLLFKNKIEKLTKESTMASHKKLGLLVETVESSHKVKASNAKWNLLSKWQSLSEDAIDDEIKIKHYTDISTYLATFSQQISYVAIVATGAYLISTSTDLTMGSLIAITILSNKVFTPIAQIPNLFVQWGRSKISLEDLDRIFLLESDNQGIDRPINYHFKSYDIRCEKIGFEYIRERPILNIQNLNIKKGEKVAILGVIGSGKSTLLKILAGLYKPTTGKIFIDNIDMQQVSRNAISKTIGYLPQENKLFSGTLRDNLSFGLINVSDEQIIEVSKKTGLINLISSLPEGLDTLVPEGGESVSGGQKQLIAFTRMLIADSDILLLDEPTASLDEGTEKYLLNILNQTLTDENTLVLVTHKPNLLNLVDRIIILTPNGILMDDKKEIVLNKLQVNSLKKQMDVKNERS